MGPVYYDNKKLRVGTVIVVSLYMLIHGTKFDIYRAITSPGFYLAWGVSILITLLLVEFVHCITNRLDVNYGWRSKSKERIVAQFLFGLFLPAVADLLIISIYFGLQGQNIFDNRYFYIDYPVVLLFLVLLNLYYIIRYLLLTNERMVEKELNKALAQIKDEQNCRRKDERQRELNRILRFIIDSNEYTPVITDILYIYRDEKRVVIVDNSGEEFPGNTTLSNLKEFLHGTHFVRINRSIILNLDTVESYKKGEKRNTLVFKFSKQYTALFKEKGLDHFTVTKENISDVELYFYAHVVKA